MTALVVDDEPVMQDYLTSFFEEAGVPVRLAGSGEEALTVVAEVWPDLVVIDLSLPGRYTGWELWDALLERAQGRLLRVAVCGGALTTADEHRARARGALVVLRKPVRKAEAVHLVQLGKGAGDVLAGSDR